MVLFLLRRLVTGVGVVLMTAVFAYGGWRFLRNDQFPGQGLIGGTWDDLERVFIHHQTYVDEWTDGLQADVWMVIGSVTMGVGLGVLMGGWCAAHADTARARVLETVAMAFMCAPPFVLGYGLLLLFHPTFGHFKMPLFFEVHVYQEPWQNPWDWFRALLVPWFVAGAPLAGACLRITRSGTVEASDEEYIRTAIAKGVPLGRIFRRHARPASYPTVFAYLSTASAAIVLNVVITESVFSVPGLLQKTRRALGERDGVYTGMISVDTRQLVAVWGAVLIVAVGIVADMLLMAKDPRVRERGRIG